MTDAVRLVRRTPVRTAPPALDADQRRVVEHPNGPLLVLAGPGTGKTTTLVETAVHWHLQRGVPLDGILLLTFGRRAAGEMRQRLVARLSYELGDKFAVTEPLAMTIHGYAYALARRAAAVTPELNVTLLTGADYDTVVRELLRGDAADGGRAWPPSLRGALELRGFADQVRDAMLHVKERGISWDELAELGERTGTGELWAALADAGRRADAASMLNPLSQAVTYPDVIAQATTYLESDDGQAEAGRRRLVVVDEYQDTDPQQVGLLRRLADAGASIIAVGDPDQAIYRFRGADPNGITRFPRQFRTDAGDDAPVVALHTCRRFAGAALTASRRVADRLPAGPGTAEHRQLAAPDGAHDSAVDLQMFTSTAAEASWIADHLRRSHLIDQLPYTSMAVLVRTASQLTALRSALGAAGVPVDVAGDEVALADEPAVAALLDAVLLAAADDIDPLALRRVVAGAIGRIDEVSMRTLRRATTAEDKISAVERTFDQALAAACHGDDDAPRALTRDPGISRVRATLAATRAALDASLPVDEVLWEAWQASGLADHYRAEINRGGPLARHAHRCLDAVISVMELAGRAVDSDRLRTPADFAATLADQQIPADSLAEAAQSGGGVRLLTAHRAKGLEWDLVVVAGVQEGVWPDLRLRDGLFRIGALEAADEGLPYDLTTARRQVLSDERRLFYVAITRGRRRTVITAVDTETTTRSRFCDELGLQVPEPSNGPTQPLTLPGVIGGLRRAACSDAPGLVADAVGTLAFLDSQAVADANPDTWWNVLPDSSDAPVLTGETVSLSPSSAETFEQCSLRWLLTRRADVQSSPGVAAAFGRIVHALADRAADPDADLEALLDVAFDGVDVEPAWYARAEREAVGRSLQLLRDYLTKSASQGRQMLATEAPFSLDLPGLRVIGRADRVEIDEDARAHIVDFKRRQLESVDDTLKNLQLAIYQLALIRGAFDEITVTESAGARLVGLDPARKSPEIKGQPALGEGGAYSADELADKLTEIATSMRANTFTARVGSWCRSCPVAVCCPAHERGRR